MKFGAQVNSFDATWDDIHPYIQTMEAGRWNSLWFADHFLPPGAPANLWATEEHIPCFDGFTLIAVAAGMTQRLKLGGLVMGNTYRNPALVAKMATTLDQASKGRVILGLGAAWFKREHEAYGWDFPSLKERSDRLQEACELIRKLFTADGPVDYDGRYYRLDQAPLSPGCYQKPRISRLWSAATGSVAHCAPWPCTATSSISTAWETRNLPDGMSVESYRHKIGVLERHCEDVGRDPAEIRGTIHMPLNLTDDKESAKRFHRNPRPRGDGRAAKLHRRSNRRVRRRRCRGDHIPPVPRCRNRTARRRGDRRGLRLGAEPRISVSA